MKTLSNGDKFKRVKDSTADDRKAIKTLLGTGWAFCDRSTWKREVRDKGKPDGEKTNLDT